MLQIIIIIIIKEIKKKKKHECTLKKTEMNAFDLPTIWRTM